MARILVVEDDPDVLDLVREALQEWGFEVDQATDGPAAYQKIYMAQPAYDLVICDLVMPLMQGQDLLRRAAGQLRDRTPVIVISARPRAIDTLGDLRDWVFCVLRKPFDKLEDLRNAVTQALKQRTTMRDKQGLEERVFELEQRLEALVRQNVDLFEEARMDALTCLPNRRRLEEDLGKKHANADRYGAPFAIALCDIDDFRRYNEDFGYEGGDRAIRHVARVLSEATREGDTVYRFGGDEFVVVMEAQTLAQGIFVADRLLAGLAGAPGPHGVDDHVTASAGVAAAQPGAERSMAGLLRQANLYLTAAKKAGGNRVHPVLEEVLEEVREDVPEDVPEDVAEGVPEKAD